MKPARVSMDYIFVVIFVYMQYRVGDVFAPASVELAFTPCTFVRVPK